MGKIREKLSEADEEGITWVDAIIMYIGVLFAFIPIGIIILYTR
jgi:hypothetical protein